ncbi:Cobalt-precorrin-4 C(11)-methyltransferase [Novipirellula aureliae]|uniref:Cobalt-precorrin-4 C(11)-methyltransferase n=1 Tax=Novipirellula aureliae TaxID=2527966 RepID=A0A5C6DLH0_9BACT|nr:SAM-dependent methyltransferase [Novipirellula aureliae]TWU36481.1 Cobalt-precorrin-4 C(11)-methyltransferase [Novipirellula aureliae]
MFQSIRSLPCLLGLLTFAALVPAESSRCRADEHESTHFYLVGIGPGDADLMTLRAAKVIESADLVLCRGDHAETFSDYLKGKEVHSEFSGMIPFYSRDPSQYEGEDRKRAEQYQQKRLRLVRLVRDAVQAGRTVAALDNGDPMIYGPCTWMLKEFEDLNPQVVPGLSSFNAANAAIGMGITSGGNTKSVTLTAGDWIKTDDTIEKLSVHRNTMVLFTMRAELQHFVEKLLLNYAPETPIAIVQQAGQSVGEKVIYSTLGEVLVDVAEEDLPFEYLIYVGNFLNQRNN